MNAHNPIKQVRVSVAVAQGLREAANACGPQQEALRARLIVAATQLDIMRELLLWFIARRRGVRLAREEAPEA
jgi:hypothetical protein